MLTYDVVALGSAIVDVFVDARDDDLVQLGLNKGSMTLISKSEAARLYEAAQIREIRSGGSAANTVAGLASLGVSSVFMGLFENDGMGEAFVEEMQSAGVGVWDIARSYELGTGRCMVFVTPDGERTMATYLGAASALEKNHVDMEALLRAKLVYIEGYLLENEEILDLVMTEFKVLREGRVDVALSLSDPLLCERLEPTLKQILNSGSVNVVFGNQAEVATLVGENDPMAATASMMDLGLSGAVTLGAEGAIGYSGGEIVQVDSFKPESVVDTTGAGDLFAAGFLYGLVNGFDLRSTTLAGVAAATEVIGHYGARPVSSLSEFVQARI